jgi:DNA-binding protein YbaB
MSYLDDEMERVMREHENSMRDLGKMQQEMADLSVEMTSANGTITVTMDARGGVTGLRLHGDRHRQLPGTELSAQIMAAITAARAEVEKKVTALMPESQVGGLDMSEMMKPDFDWASMLPKMMGDIESTTQGLRPGFKADGKVT